MSPLISSAKNLIDQKKYQDAVTACSAALIRDPQSREAYRLRAIANRYLKEFDKSINDYSRALAVDPKGYDLFAGRAVTKREMNNLQGAIQDMAEAARRLHRRTHSPSL